eukprot:m.200175 g.200175  ORF g.200175 m.200175 type:complete len:189 (-) comp18781_c0_seq10:435-1001(-)
MIIQVHFTAREFGIPFLSFSYVLPPYDVFHACCHLASVDDLPIWEREALVEKARLKQEEEEETERLRLREEAKLTLAQQRTHPGRYVDWNKLVGSEKGFRNVKMGSVWSCCGEATETAIGCIDAELSELHARCIRCGTAFFPFELPKPCRFHSGRLCWKELSGTKYRWNCCDRLAHEEGCSSFSKHVL